MIFEYAVEPALLNAWKDRNTASYIKEQFGLGKNRLVSRFPRHWKKMAYSSCTAGDDMEQKRVEELITRLSEHMVIRKEYGWRLGASWRENAENEHQRVPFHAILAQDNPTANPAVLVNDDIIDATPLWRTQSGGIVRRKAADMAGAVRSMLCCCNTAIFIDPHFMPDNIRYRTSLQAFLFELTALRPKSLPTRVEVHTNAEKCEIGFFCDTCNEKLPQIIPAGLKVAFIRWKRRPDGQKLHNRYILTDLGGVKFQHGLDEGDDGETDDIDLLNREQYELRWNQYAGDKPAFDLEKSPFEIIGQWVPPN
ncbi:MAG: hypothetical protein C4520_04815 [Candidatus Abyssobacteria bacterium SURF_5]|uniref:Uncharacterized protein n=1 Tax=Abyssobacteria bacterium (strain SURF_5) TaxID=2093360 RepID=A0A3A4P3U7_ABYX5|nr:MAG: hypothetical protein C4520_04815 [Candidatus Abyssubacteria bacterium SURF_5]